jgi:hypothetical protein
MHRVGEAGEEVRAAEDRRAWDLQSCDNIFKALNLNMTSEKAVRFCRRVGDSILFFYYSGSNPRAKKGGGGHGCRGREKKQI